ncbi:MAG: amidohydrolase family protein [Marinoscillum sp.]|uniref:amidohydrolase family protein n=1 Tax=Marinoscillum sp. TaxID=2024838 RepID=UPI0032F4F575
MTAPKTPLKIDMHTHILPEKLPNFAEKFGYGEFISLLHHRQGAALMMKGDKFFREIEENCWDPEVRIRDYEKFNTKIQVVCTIPVMFSYWAEPKDCLDLSMFLNDHIAEVVERHPKHYIGLGTVPMQDVDMAIGELERMKELGLPGVQIGSNINQHNLSKPRFFEFFEACEKLDMAVLVHPWDMMGKADMEKYWLPWLVGMPAETARAVASMIFGGVFARYPKLRVCFAHAGGSFLTTIGRLERGFECRPDLVAVHNNVNPREYLGKFWVDSITHDPMLLDYVIKLIGSDKVCLGSDYPFPLGDLEIGKFIEEMNLPEDDLENIMYRSTLDWLGLGSKEEDQKVLSSFKKEN